MSQTGTDRLQSVEELWADFKATADQSARDRLIFHYSPLVKYVAGRVAAAMPSHVDYADLVSYGILGLIDAIEKFDPSRAIKFETYGVPHVRGAILDELRSIDWVPRSVRAKARAVDTAFSKLEGTLGRSPTDRELADELEMTTSDLDDILRQTSERACCSSTTFFSAKAAAGARRLATPSRTKVTLPEPPSSWKRPGASWQKRSSASTARAQGAHALLLRGPEPSRDRRDPRGDREPRLPDPHQGGAPPPPATARQAGLILKAVTTARSSKLLGAGVSFPSSKGPTARFAEGMPRTALPGTRRENRRVDIRRALRDRSCPSRSSPFSGWSRRARQGSPTGGSRGRNGRFCRSRMVARTQGTAAKSRACNGGLNGLRRQIASFLHRAQTTTWCRHERLPTVAVRGRGRSLRT